MLVYQRVSPMLMIHIAMFTYMGTSLGMVLFNIGTKSELVSVKIGCSSDSSMNNDQI